MNDPLQKAIDSFNHEFNNFDALHYFLNEHLDKTTAERYMSRVVPAIARLALRLPELITQVKTIVENLYAYGI